MQPAITAMFSTDAHGIEAIYRGVPINAMGCGGDGQEAITGSYDKNGKSTTLFLRVLKTDVAKPGYGDDLMLDGVAWKMKRVVSSAQFSWKLRFERNRRPSL